MKKLIIAGALSAAFASPAVFAQAQNFEGFGLQLSTGYQNNEIKNSDITVSGISIAGIGAQDVSKGDVPLNIGVGYTLAITDRFTLGALAEFNPLGMNAGDGYLTANGVNDPTTKYTGKIENQFSLSIVPGYAFTDKSMGYAKLGWINATSKVTSDLNATSFSKNVNGILLGLGAKHLLTKNIFAFAEATYASYEGGNATSPANFGPPLGTVTLGGKMTPTSYSFLVGVGVRF